MFETVNPTTFKFYYLFISIYSISFAYFIIAEILIKKLSKKHKLYKKFLRHTLGWALFYSLTGAVLLFARYAYIYFLSMEFLHILNAIILVIGLISPAKKLYKELKNPA